VTAYAGRAEGVMEVARDGVGRFKSVVLHPTVTVTAGSNLGWARTLHKPAHEKCFIANSVNFRSLKGSSFVARGGRGLYRAADSSCK
jgi:organic hydroperoxide reductase OsmC/OhrA